MREIRVALQLASECFLTRLIEISDHATNGTSTKHGMISCLRGDAILLMHILEHLLGTRRNMTIRVGGRIFCCVAFTSLWFGLLTLIVTLNGGTGHSPDGGYDPRATDPQLERIWQEFGVRVHANFEAAIYFPMLWRIGVASPKGVQIEPDALAQLRRLIPGFLAMYPRTIVANNLHDIYLLKSMTVNGMQYGGTYYRDSIYITSGGDHRVSDSRLFAMMHSEFSSILLKNYKFPTDEWNRINERGWKYIGSGVGTLGPGLYQATDDLFKKGFTCKYGQSSMEEDVNMFVFMAVNQPDALISAANRHRAH